MTSLYLHLPFCERKCFYCSFSVVIGQEKRIAAYLDALEREAQLFKGQTISTIYLGGGTPSLLSPQELQRLFQMIKSTFSYEHDAELTLEANPENLDYEKAQRLKDFGVNRISMGVQTFNDRYLKYLGRVHHAAKALQSFQDLRRAGFKNINVDLMFSFPEQSDAELKEDLQRLIDLGSEHVSLYTLTIEENSRFFAQKVASKDSHEQGDQWDLVVNTLQGAGIEQYEISNFSRPGYESRHNQHYWQGGNYIGLGMSSHSHHDGRRSWNVSRFKDYLERLSQNLSPEEGFEILSPEKRLLETLLFGLRMNAGVQVKELETRYQTALPVEVKERIQELTTQHLFIQDGPYLKASQQGRKVLDEISVRLI